MSVSVPSCALQDRRSIGYGPGLIIQELREESKLLNEWAYSGLICGLSRVSSARADRPPKVSSRTTLS